MQFLSPWMLWGLAAIAAPIAIHLWQRRQVVQLPFSTLRYLRAAAARTSRNARLENLLLLLMRCTIFGLLALAAARPAAERKAVHAVGGNVSRTVVFVVDRSMSMGYRIGERTRLDEAKEQALAVLECLKPGDEAALFAVDDRADPIVAQPTQDRAVLRRAIEGVRVGEGATDFSTGLIAARSVLAASAKPEHELYLFTDNQAVGWQFDGGAVFDAVLKRTGTSLLVIRPDDTESGNAAVAKVAITTPLATEGGRVNGTATVANHSATVLHDVLTIGFVNGEAANVAVEVPPESALEVGFELTLPAYNGGKIARGVARLQGDNLPPDDRFYFSVPVHQPPRTLVFEGTTTGAERMHSGFYLRRALAVGARDGSGPQALPASAIEETDLAGYSIVFLVDSPPLTDRAVLKLDNFARGGGTVVYFPGDRTELSALGRVDFLPAVALRTRELPVGRLSSQVTEPGNPLFADTWSAEVPFPPLPLHRLIEWKLKPDARALVLAGDSEAFLIAADFGSGRVYIVNTSPDRAWGDFPLSPAFLPLVQQMALQSSEHGKRPESYTVGQGVPASALLPRDTPLVLTLPDGSTRPLQLGEQTMLLERTPQAGVYQIGPTEQPALWSFDVNPPVRESALTPITEAALNKITPHETITGTDGLRLWLTQSRGMVPLWPVLLVFAALVFALESLLANLAARRRAQGGVARIRTGRLNKRRQGSPFRAENAVTAP